MSEMLSTATGVVQADSRVSSQPGWCRIPFSTDGGLIGRGHPGGPTGLAQIWDVTRQLRGEAGPLQVEGARTGLAHMMGAGSVCVIHILQAGR